MASATVVVVPMSTGRFARLFAIHEPLAGGKEAIRQR